MVDNSVVERAVVISAEVPRMCLALRGMDNRDLIDEVATAILKKELHLHFRKTHRIEVWGSEGAKDDAAHLTPGSEYGSLDDGAPRLSVLADPFENTGQFARGASATRGSMSLLVLAADGCLPPFEFDDCFYAMKLVVPPGSPVGPGAINLTTPPARIIDLLARRFGRRRNEIHVWTLARDRNRHWFEGFQETGAVVHAIQSGDFEPALLAGAPVRPGRPIHVTIGAGGLFEGFLAAPYLRWTGATMLLRPLPNHLNGQDDPALPVYDTRRLVQTPDCVLCVAGVTESPEYSVVRGVRFLNGEVQVTVFVASPAWGCRYYAVNFPAGLSLTALSRTPPAASGLSANAPMVS